MLKPLFTVYRLFENVNFGVDPPPYFEKSLHKKRTLPLITEVTSRVPPPAGVHIVTGTQGQDISVLCLLQVEQNIASLLYIISYIRKCKYCPATTTTPAVSRSGYPPLDSETEWTGELWSNRVLLILEN